MCFVLMYTEDYNGYSIRITQAHMTGDEKVIIVLAGNPVSGWKPRTIPIAERSEVREAETQSALQSARDFIDSL